MNVKRMVMLASALFSLGAFAGTEQVFFAACEGKAEKAGCQVSLTDGDHEGVCRTDDQNQKACMPPDSPPAKPAPAVATSQQPSAQAGGAK